MTRGPYSYSRMATFKKCPAKFKYAYMDKVDVPFIPSPAMVRGSEIHDSLEAFVSGHSEILHPDIHEHYGQFFFSIRETAKTIEPEHRWALNWDLEPCDYNDSNCMVRGFMDLRFTMEGQRVQIYEYKTGKIYPEHHAQMWLYGVATLLEMPDEECVDVTAVYLDQKKNKKISYPRSMLFEYKPMLMKEIQEIEDRPESEFHTNPSYACRWCQFSKNNGGPCQF